jgi:NAD(P)-dependent dehydrogenase (short-subunit alcohol dehydrogenase family)
MTRETALVTGGNRGLGLECCRQLAERGLSVLLTSRNPAEGEAAAARLRGEGLAVDPAGLDVTSAQSITALADRLRGEQRAVHVLVNNAAISLGGFGPEVAERTLATNYFGAAAVTEGLLPLLMKSFPEDVRRGDHRRKGWPSNAYSVSKVGLNALVRVWAPALGARALLINAVCPGWVRTDMGGRSAPRSIAQGAAGIVWAALLPRDGPTGGFFRDGRPIPW